MRLSLYNVDSSYCEYLRNFDPKILQVSENKARRPFLGIVIELDNGIKYYAPLTSPKPKHLNMKDSIDFIKIRNGALGAINLNNMIPVDDEFIRKVDLKIKPDDTKEDIKYKILLSDQISWCNANRDKIVKYAKKLYKLITENKAPKKLADRCCDFKLLEQKCIEYRELRLSQKEIAITTTKDDHKINSKSFLNKYIEKGAERLEFLHRTAQPGQERNRRIGRNRAWLVLYKSNKVDSMKIKFAL